MGVGRQQREQFGQQLVAGPVYYSVLEQGPVQGPLEPGSQQGEQDSGPVFSLSGAISASSGGFVLR